MKKDVGSQLIAVQLIATADGSDVTTGTTNVAVELDGVAGTGGTATHVANGKWEYAPIQADTNADHITFQFTNTSAVTVLVNVYTTTPQTGDSYARIGANGAGLTDLATASALATVDSEVGDIKTKTDYLPSATAGSAGGVFIAGTNAATTVTTSFTTTFTGNLTGDVQGNVDGSTGSVTSAVTLPTIPTNWLTAAGLATDAVNEIVDQVWNESVIGHSSALTFGKTVQDLYVDTQAIIVEIGTAGDGLTDLGGMSAAMKAEVNAEADIAIGDAALATAAALSTVDTEVGNLQATADAIETDTQDLQTQIGTAGAGLTNINLPNQTMDITGNITGNLSGSVGSVTGNVGGNVTGSVGSNLELGPAEVNAEVDSAIETYGLDHLVATSVLGSDIADDSIIASLVSKEATADWDDFDNTTDSLQAIKDIGVSVDLATMFTSDTGETYGSAVAGSVVKEIADNAGGSSLTLGDIADAVWDESVVGHSVALSFGKTAQDIFVDTQAIVTNTAPIATGTADSGSTTTLVDSARTESDTDYWAGCVVRFTSGSIAGQVRAITAFDAGTDTITFTPATTQAVSTNTYSILPAAAASLDGTAAADIADAVLAETVADHSGDSGSLAGVLDAAATATALATMQGNVTDILTDTGTTIPALFPFGFSTVVINSGAVDALVQGFLNNTIAETTADNIAANFETFYDNADATTSQTVDDVGSGGGGGASVNDIWNAPSSSHTTPGTFGYYLDARVSTAGGSGSGSRVVNITVVDDLAAVVPGVTVNLQTAAGVTLSGLVKQTNASGVATFNLDDDDYKGLVTAGPGYTTHTAEAFTVDEDDEAVTLTITRLTAPTASGPGLCAVSCYIYQNGVAIENAVVIAKLDDSNSTTGDVNLSRAPLTATTDANGLATLELVQQGEFVTGDGTYTISCAHEGERMIYQSVLIPNAASARLEDLIT